MAEKIKREPGSFYCTDANILYTHLPLALTPACNGSSYTLFGQLSIDHNMDFRLQAPTVARKCDISHWFLCGVDRRTDERTQGNVTTNISWMDR